MKIPEKFIDILIKNQTIHSIVLDVISSFEPIFKDNKLFFFEEYTDHGINHIEKVLGSAEFIISVDSFENITPNEISILILSIILHDLGMHVELSTFNSMLNGEYDNTRIAIIDDKTWSELWNEYLSEVKRFSTIQKRNIFGDGAMHFSIPDLSNKDNLTGYDKKLIGEFIRRHHGRFAQEVSLLGLKSENGLMEFGTNKLDKQTKQLAGILARSHSMNVRDTFIYLKDIAHDSWRNPHGINIIYLMVVLRIADYIQIDNTRVNPFLLKLKSFNSPISQLENFAHLAINSLNFNNVDKENIYVDCSPADSEMFVKIRALVIDIQNELDKSWAILGEIYGFIPNNKPSIKFRRISSNLENKSFLKKLDYLPEKITFKVDNNLSKLLVAPLYGENPTFGVRELLQNSIDACSERKEIEYQRKNYNYIPEIEVSINTINEKESLFSIKDNGKGMSSDEIINYFLNVGSSFRKSMDWKKQFIDEEGKTKINRNGKFGIGVLASFLLGKEIKVETRNILKNESLSFTASLDAEFINVLKNQSNNDFGTNISIIIDNENRKKLINHQPNWDDKSISWTDWYLFDEPNISFLVDKEVFKPNNLIKDVIFYEFATKEFEKISWSYDVKDTDRSSKNLIACNGLIITEDYDSDEFLYPEHDSEETSYYSRKPVLIKDKPSILVVDKEGVFPVKLDRNDIDCDEFPFEKELMIETSKHFIAQLLSAEVNNKQFKPCNIVHSPKLIYGAEGFIIDSEYFISGVKDNYRFVRILCEERQIETNISMYKECLFDFQFESRITLSYQEHNIAPDGGGLILLPKNKYESLFKSKVKRLNKYVTDNASIVEENEKYTLYKIYNFEEKPALLKNLKKIDKELLKIAVSIQEVTSKLYKTREGNILNELFKKYIKNQFIIPYNIDKRKLLYKEAFRELSQYLNS
jgi:molecular chaperone HtpG